MEGFLGWRESLPKKISTYTIDFAMALSLRLLPCLGNDQGATEAPRCVIAPVGLFYFDRLGLRNYLATDYLRLAQGRLGTAGTAHDSGLPAGVRLLAHVPNDSGAGTRGKQQKTAWLF